MSIRSILLSTGIFFSLFLPISANAAVNPVNTFKSTVQKSDLIEVGAEIPTAQLAIANIIRNLLLYVGILIVLLVIYSGFLWATARGNEEQIKKAKRILVGSIIGLLIIFAAAGIVDFVLTNVISQSFSS